MAKSTDGLNAMSIGTDAYACLLVLIYSFRLVGIRDSEGETLREVT